MKDLLRPRDRSRGTRSALPERKHAVSSRRRCSASLNVQGLIDRLVADAHGLVPRVIDQKPTSDLLGAPGRRPAPALPVNGPSLFPYHLGALEGDATRVCDFAGQTLLHIFAQSRTNCQLARPRPPGRTISMPLGGTGSVIEFTAARGSIASHFPRNRARATDRAYAQWPGYRFPWRARAQYPRVPERKDNAQSAASPMGRNALVAFLLHSETSANQEASKHRNLVRPPRSSGPRQ